MVLSENANNRENDSFLEAKLSKSQSRLNQQLENKTNARRGAKNHKKFQALSSDEMFKLQQLQQIEDVNGRLDRDDTIQHLLNVVSLNKVKAHERDIRVEPLSSELNSGSKTVEELLMNSGLTHLPRAYLRCVTFPLRLNTMETTAFHVKLSLGTELITDCLTRHDC